MSEKRLSVDQVNVELVRQVLRNLVIECSSVTQVVVKQGSTVGAEDGSRILTAAADITIDITSSGANGLDTGTEAANTWYYIWLIMNPSTETVSGLLSASATAPTMPSGYTVKRLVGAVRNNGSSNFWQFRQDKNLCSLSGNVTEFCTSVNVALFPGGTSFDISGHVPVAIASQLFLQVNATRSSTGTTPTAIFASHNSSVYRSVVHCPNTGAEEALGMTQIYHAAGSIYLGKLVADNVTVDAYIPAFFLNL